MTAPALPLDSTQFLNKITSSLLEAAIVVEPSKLIAALSKICCPTMPTGASLMPLSLWDARWV